MYARLISTPTNVSERACVNTERNVFKKNVIRVNGVTLRIISLSPGRAARRGAENASGVVRTTSLTGPGVVRCYIIIFTRYTNRRTLSEFTNRASKMTARNRPRSNKAPANRKGVPRFCFFADIPAPFYTYGRHRLRFQPTVTLISDELGGDCGRDLSGVLPPPIP